MKRTLLWLLVAVAMLIAVFVYRFRSGRNLNVEPHARDVIEKAKER